jgi:hypothetical protein
MNSRITQDPRDAIRAYAAGALSWSELRTRGLNYVEVLGGLGELGLRPPIAPMEGPNVEARRRGRRRLRELLTQSRL